MSTLQFNDNDGWEIYPENLSRSPPDLEASRNSSRISQLSKDLFVANQESTFQYVAIGVPGNSKSSSLTCLPVLN